MTRLCLLLDQYECLYIVTEKKSNQITILYFFCVNITEMNMIIILKSLNVCIVNSCCFCQIIKGLAHKLV